MRSPARAESREVILNPGYKPIFNFDASECPNRHGNEFYYRRGSLGLHRASTSNFREVWQLI